MAFMFRFPIELPQDQSIGSTEQELMLLSKGSVRVFIQSDTSEALAERNEVSVRGTGFATEAEARMEGERWFNAVPVGFVHENLGANFRLRRPRSGFFGSYLEQRNAEHPESRLVNDEPGVVVYPEEPPLIFGKLRVKGRAGINAEAVALAVREAYDSRVRLDDATRIAFEMYSASYTMPSVDSSFLMLMVGVEAMIAAIKARAGESISAAGRRLAASLGDAHYLDQSPVDFFRECYRARSALVHGDAKRPDLQFIMNATGPLRVFVKDLIELRVRAGTSAVTGS